MPFARASAFALILSVLALAACQPNTVPANPPLHEVSAPPPTGGPSIPAPAKNVIMVCRNSQTGATAECGTPNAVMVGVKEK